MIYSLSEIDANCKKAARGAGLSWGYAEETGKAARWLAAHQLPGAELLAEYLTIRQKKAENSQGAHPHCPLLTGARLCDAAIDLKKTIVLENIVYPLLLLPYLAQLSQAAGRGLRIQWTGTHISCHDGVVFIKENASIASREADMVGCCWLEPETHSPISLGKEQKNGVTGQLIDSNDWAALEALAHFTYVPATEASRRGAGPS